MTTPLNFGAKSDVGQIRSDNEDAYLIEEPLFAIADGMGGHLAGDVAAATAVDVISQGIQEENFGPRALEALIERANREIWQKAQGDTALSGMGTTCTVFLVEDSKGHLAHVGDSRAYILHQGRLRQLTEDHTLVARMVREGRLDPQDADRHPQRNVVTRALGVDESVAVDTMQLDLQEGDRVLLCSDGLTSMVSIAEIERILIAADDPQSAADQLVATANEAGGEDNITVLVIDVGSTAERAPTVARSPAREDTAPDPEGGPHQKRWLGPVLKILLSLAVIAGIAFAASRLTLANSWYVGVNEDGFVTIYKGIPEEIVGVRLQEVAQVSSLSIDEVPEFRQEQVSEGYKVGSEDEAEDFLSNLERLSRDFQGQQQEQKG